MVCESVFVDSLSTIGSLTYDIAIFGRPHNSSCVDQAKAFYYRVRFDRWGSSYDGWYEESELTSATQQSRSDVRNLIRESRMNYANATAFDTPDTIETLFAYRFVMKQVICALPL